MLICSVLRCGVFVRRARTSRSQWSKTASLARNRAILALAWERFADVQIGKEAIFGVVVSEHHPFAEGAEVINDELREISSQWLKGKGNHELGFVLGSLGLDHPSAKRYFIGRCENGTGRIEGFIVCEPIYGRSGYYLDVTRRRPDAVRGTMELLTTEILRSLHDRGYHMASMGLAPLALLRRVRRRLAICCLALQGIRKGTS